MKPKRSSFQYVEVAPAIPLPASAHQTFTYRTPNSIKELEAVNIPFGPRRIQGIVIKTDQPKPRYPTKDATPPAKPQAITPLQYKFGQWISAHMRGGLGYTLRLFLGPATTNDKTNYTDSKFTEKIVLEKYTLKRYGDLQEASVAALREGKQVLILVPEVSHIAPLEKVFGSKANVLAVFAGQKPSAKSAAWQAAGSGQPVVVIGTQKALFLPWQNLGLIILEQAQHTTHKLWDQYPRLDNRYGARALAAIHGATHLVSGSAPSLAMWQTVQVGEVEVLKNNPYLKTPQVISSTFEDKKNRRMLPLEVTTTIRRALKKHARIFILYNKRGIWQAMRCRKCHAAVRCPDCDVVALVQGKSKASKTKKTSWQLVCRSCNKAIPTPAVCPKCHQDGLAPTRLGGVTMQSILALLHPGQTVDRLDADSLQGLSPEAISKKINQSNLIIGTNAALTHLEPGSFTHVFWVFPEDALSYPDVRSSERAWLLASRLAELSSKNIVTLVTRQPHLIAGTIGQDPAKFLHAQLKERQRLQYPPFADLVRLTFIGKKQSQAEKARLELKKRLGKHAKVRGPYQGIDQSKRSQAQTHLLLTGSLPELQTAYQHIPCDVVDVAPDRII